MNPPGSQTPLSPNDPLMQVLGQGESEQEVDSQAIGSEERRIVYPPQENGEEVIPTGNYPQEGEASLPPRRYKPARQTQTSVGADETEIISVLPDPTASRRRRVGNRKAMSPFKLLGLFLVAQTLIVAVVVLFFGHAIRNWLMGSELPTTGGLSRNEAEELRSHLHESQGEFKQLGSDIETVKKQISVSPGDAWKELEILEQRNQLTLLADDAITNGSRLAYDKLVILSKDTNQDKRMQDGAVAEIVRVKSFYASGVRMGAYRIPVQSLFPSSVLKSEEALKASQLVGLLTNLEKSWKVRARAAYLLGSRRGGLPLCEYLVTVAKTDPNLDVVKECIVSFEQITGYRSKQQFDIADLEEWWVAYEARISAREEQARAEDPS